MRLWPTLLLGSGLLLLVTAYLHFFNSDLKEELKTRRKVEYQSFKTLKTNERLVREKSLERRKRLLRPTTKKYNKVAQDLIDSAQKDLLARCEREGKYFYDNPDLIDPNSVYFKNLYKGFEIMKRLVYGHSDALYNLANNSFQIDEAITKASDSLNSDKLLSLIMANEQLVRDCNLGDTVAPVLMSFSEAIAEKNTPELNPRVIALYANLARAAFQVKTFSAFEIGLGALRNMNSFAILSEAEAADLEILSDRVQKTYDSYRLEAGQRAETASELQEVYLYYQIEREVLFQILQEYANNLEATYPAP